MFVLRASGNGTQACKGPHLIYFDFLMMCVLEALRLKHPELCFKCCEAYKAIKLSFGFFAKSSKTLHSY